MNEHVSNDLIKKVLFKGKYTYIITDPETGETHSLREWSQILNINYDTLSSRIKDEWPAKDVLHWDKRKTHKANPKFGQNRSHVDLTGKKFGKLTVLRRADTDYMYTSKDGKKHYEWKWVCQCDCPDKNIIEVIQHNLTNGHTKNCGCESKVRAIDMTGKRCGNLTVIEKITDKSEIPDNFKNCGVVWRCVDDEGNEHILPGGNIRTRNKFVHGGFKSNHSVGGESNTDIYTVYKDMYQRCYNKNEPAYKDYGGRGIIMCDDWKPHYINGRNQGYFNFRDWALANGYEKGLTIDRRNNNGIYEPSNCRFITMKEQNNNRRSNRLVTYNNTTKTCTEMAESIGMNPVTFRHRLNKGMTTEEAIETPLRFKMATTSFGETHTLSEWSEISGIDRKVLYSRIIILGWNVDMALLSGATNPEIYNHIPYGFNPAYYDPASSTITMYTDILGNKYTPEQWQSHQAVFFD